MFYSVSRDTQPHVSKNPSLSAVFWRKKKRLLEAGLTEDALWQRRERLNKLIDQDRLKDPKVLACSPVVTPNPLFCVISFKDPAFLREYGVLLALKHLQSITVLDEAGNCGA